jgi:cyanophycinase-like exopeptidase
MTKTSILFVSLLIWCNIKAQTSYTSYFTGDTSNVIKATHYRLCLMGGATEDDNAMKWFLNGSGGGDIVVIRVTGSNGYNSYLFSSLGISVNSVETIVIPSIAAANHPYVKRRLREAEAVFIAGGNQNDYATFWKNTQVDSALNYLINTKKVPIGGTSAGMAIQGQAYFTAAVSSITSSVALTNPYSAGVTIGNNDFLHNPILKRVITDTHYDNPDRRGRQSTFLARLFQDSAKAFYGIACDEYTAVCIDSTGIAKVFGGFPTYDDNAYFIQPNCTLPNTPENCITSQPLTWNRNDEALKVYAVKGTSLGVTCFDLKNWQNPSTSGGTWQNWYIVNGSFSVTLNANPINCIATSLQKNNFNNSIEIFPNPANSIINLSETIENLIITDITGKQILQENNTKKVSIAELENGIYFIHLKSSTHYSIQKFIKN